MIDTWTMYRPVWAQLTAEERSAWAKIVGLLHAEQMRRRRASRARYERRKAESEMRTMVRICLPRGREDRLRRKLGQMTEANGCTPAEAAAAEAKLAELRDAV